jgi:hypothetical protein
MYSVGNTFYVYTLAYPDGTVFYVGKGRSRRIDAHEREARKGVQSTKCDIIRGIWRDGEQVVKAKVSESLSHHEAMSYEEQLIRQYNPLGNQLPGRKPMECEFRKRQIGYSEDTHRSLLIRGLPLDIVMALQEQAQEAGLKCEVWLFQQIVQLAKREVIHND